MMFFEIFNFHDSWGNGDLTTKVLLTYHALIVMVWQLKSGSDKVLWAMCTPWIMKLQERLPKQWLWRKCYILQSNLQNETICWQFPVGEVNSLHCSFFISNGTKIFHTGISLFSLLKLNTFNTQLTIAKILCHNSWCGLQYPSEGTFLRGEKRGSSRWCSWVSLYHLPQCVPEHYILRYWMS